VKLSAIVVSGRRVVTLAVQVEVPPLVEQEGVPMLLRRAVGWAAHDSEGEIVALSVGAPEGDHLGRVFVVVTL